MQCGCDCKWNGNLFAESIYEEGIKDGASFHIQNGHRNQSFIISVEDWKNGGSGTVMTNKIDPKILVSNDCIIIVSGYQGNRNYVYFKMKMCVAANGDAFVIHRVSDNSVGLL